MLRVMARYPTGPRLHQRARRLLQRGRARRGLVRLRQRPFPARLLARPARYLCAPSSTRAGRSPSTTTPSTAASRTTASTSTTTRRCSSWPSTTTTAATGDLAWLRGIYPAVAKAGALHHLAGGRARPRLLHGRRPARQRVGHRRLAQRHPQLHAQRRRHRDQRRVRRGAARGRPPGREPGQPTSEAHAFFDAAQALRAAMDTHLLNPENGLYYLNIDADGNAAHRRHRRRDLPGHVPRLRRRDGLPHHQPPQLARLLDRGGPAHGLAATIRCYDPFALRGADRRRVAGADLVVRLRRGALPPRVHGHGAARLVRALRRRPQDEQHRAGPVQRVVRRREPDQPRDAPLALGAAALSVGGRRGRLRADAHARSPARQPADSGRRGNGWRCAGCPTTAAT